MTRAAGTPGPTGAFVTLDGEPAYRISGCHRMPPFLTSVASATDLWMFVTSTGGLTAGRKDPDGALFPYETVDRLGDGHHHTGPVTLLRVRGPDGAAVLWRPFSDDGADDPRIERNLYKNVVGNRLVFEEVHHGLGLAFRSRWSGCDAFGLVRTATLENRGAGPLAVELLDGLRNVLPHGAPLALYQHSSCLVDAYKRADLEPGTSLALYSLTAAITDRAEAAEELRANVVWCTGLPGADVSLSLDAVAAFRRGEAVAPRHLLTGARGNYLVRSSLALEPGAGATWHVVADTGLGHVEVEALRARLLAGGDLGRAVEEALDAAREDLRRIVASADGLQLTAHAETTAHHFASVLFNVMRGGVFARNHDVPTADLLAFLRTRNRPVARRHGAALAALPDEVPVRELLRVAADLGDPDLARLCHEYLPIHFGRRHGDPSRPWNRFSIRLKDADGGPALDYEGNWRDIFQNWEALCLSFPHFLPGVVARFVNASTVDGHNPYRVTRDGIDWEVPDPRAPWGNIGYWGDHQVVYLLRFLEALPRHSPGALEDLLAREIFCYAEVPYRIRPHAEIVADPRASIAYDAGLAARIEERVAETGTDGKLVRDRAGAVHHVSLLEKLLVPALAKLSNLVPDAGIWMNTQRPEWNDANNALAGHGVSMVTLFHLRRYLAFLAGLLERRGDARVPVSAEVATWLRRVHEVLRSHPASAPCDDRERRARMDALGCAASDHRHALYAHGFSGAKEALPATEVVALCRGALEHLDHAIRANRRDDGLYHSYHVLELSRDGRGAAVRPLEEMLEGQVAALGSGVVEPPEAVRLLDALFASRMYRPDQRSFMLYPEKELPPFLERNRVPDERVGAVPLLGALLEAGDASVLARDARGACRFQADLRNACDLAAALDRLALHGRWAAMVARDRQAVLDTFEAVFRHHAFTGRSGRMYAYEGLGCIYWHMVSKLLLAVQEIALRAADEGRPEPVRGALAAAYHRIRGGLGFEKPVAEYGAFPTDPYSHTPRGAGAQQPGMTGQVKEDILARFGELGVVVEDGTVSFRPALLRAGEFLAAAETYPFVDVEGNARPLPLAAGSLAFSLCQVPVVYRLTGGEAWIEVTDPLGAVSTRSGDRLDAATSGLLFSRCGALARIEVGIPEASLCRP